MASDFTIGPRVDVKALFFDRVAVESAVSKMEHKSLSKGGAFVRRRARSSIRKRKGHSRPGRPPTNRTGLLREGILFAFEPLGRSVVIGPVRLNKPGLVPALHEFGGSRQVTSAEAIAMNRAIRRLNALGRDASGRFLSAADRGNLVEVHTGQSLKYPPRPYMRPALEAEAPKFPDLFKDALVGPGA